MTEKTPASKKGFSADWLMRGALTRIGDTFDRLTGRRWTPSSSLATSELIERVKNILDAEAKEVPGKGVVVPHNIKLKMQWDKFSTDADDTLTKLQNELLTAAADHINDSRYYTYAPLQVDVKPDYFTEGVKLFVSFEKFGEDDGEVEMNVTVPAITSELISAIAPPTDTPHDTFIAKYELRGIATEKRLEVPAGGRLSVGRTGGNDLIIDDISVSKIHASLVVNSEGQLSVADTGSTNGTFINDQRISYGKVTALVEGDEVKFGTVTAVFEHVPRQVVVEPEAAVEDTADDRTIKIDGLEFKSKSTVGTVTDIMPDAPTLEDTAEIENEQHEMPETENRDSEPSNDGEA